VWNVSLVTTFSNLFTVGDDEGIMYHAKSCDADISRWRTTQVTSTYAMFKKNERFNANIGN
jgi:hypothetical protein